MEEESSPLTGLNEDQIKELRKAAALLDEAQRVIDTKVLALSMMARSAHMFAMLVKAGVCSMDDVQGWWEYARTDIVMDQDIDMPTFTVKNDLRKKLN